MNGKYNTSERLWVGKVKQQDCSVCDAPGPSAAHHMDQGYHYTTIALCWECHQGKQGWHGERGRWRQYKMDPIKALNVTIGRVLNATR